jgi:hypothetical protein
MPDTWCADRGVYEHAMSEQADPDASSARADAASSGGLRHAVVTAHGVYKVGDARFVGMLLDVFPGAIHIQGEAAVGSLSASETPVAPAAETSAETSATEVPRPRAG